MRFHALPVNVGDSFLLNYDDKFILVEGGMNKRHIIDLLKKEKIPKNHIDVLICSHYDADHINGILGILESNKYSFKEIWLPEILGSISYTLSKNLRELLDYFRNSFNLEVNDNIDSSLNLPVAEYEENSLEKIDTIVLSEITTFYPNPWYWKNYGYFWSDLLDTPLSMGLYKTCSIVRASLLSGSYIRWFKYLNNGVDYRCGYNLIAMNAKETGITLYKPIDLLMALYLTTINKESLVFLFNKDELPNILFCADSDLSFCSTNINLRDNSIITAPHHGSEENQAVYSKINGNNLYFVRSDRSQLRRPGPTYLKQNVRYCTICRNKTPKQKVELAYRRGSIITSATPCSC
jgi:hypothetical protein